MTKQLFRKERQRSCTFAVHLNWFYDTSPIVTELCFCFIMRIDLLLNMNLAYQFVLIISLTLTN